jgi:hypothetical protein
MEEGSSSSASGVDGKRKASVKSCQQCIVKYRTRLVDKESQDNKHAVETRGISGEGHLTAADDESSSTGARTVHEEKTSDVQKVPAPVSTSTNPTTGSPSPCEEDHRAAKNKKDGDAIVRETPETFEDAGSSALPLLPPPTAATAASSDDIVNSRRASCGGEGQTEPAPRVVESAAVKRSLPEKTAPSPTSNAGCGSFPATSKQSTNQSTSSLPADASATSKGTPTIIVEPKRTCEDAIRVIPPTSNSDLCAAFCQGCGCVVKRCSCPSPTVGGEQHAPRATRTIVLEEVATRHNDSHTNNTVVSCDSVGDSSSLSPSHSGPSAADASEKDAQQGVEPSPCASHGNPAAVAPCGPRSSGAAKMDNDHDQRRSDLNDEPPQESGQVAAEACDAPAVHSNLTTTHSTASPPTTIGEEERMKHGSSQNDVQVIVPHGEEEHDSLTTTSSPKAAADGASKDVAASHNANDSVAFDGSVCFGSSINESMVYDGTSFSSAGAEKAEAGCVSSSPSIRPGELEDAAEGKTRSGTTAKSSSSSHAGASHASLDPESQKIASKCSRFLRSGETIVKIQTIKKTRYMISHERVLVLTDQPRLYYVDEGNVCKGSLMLDPRTTRIVSTGPKTFVIKIEGGKDYNFTTPEVMDADRWVHAIQKLLSV